MTELANKGRANEADWDSVLEPATVAAIEAAARIVAGKYGDNAVNMLAEYEDMRQEGFILVATKERLQGLDPRLLTFRLTQELNGRVKYGASRASATVYLSALERA
ncbi:hypothetical protein [Micromonospora sp. WMMD736]|uniref:hypothetical protein n=1 Tax=Micromonospora sp. WMMD736 TaxID=3404112 RepID=UPI003B9474FF